ncbi:MAG: helix-turn-helix domain-containing protein [Armatimonadetes bacterium]|nr:helix-turn-helix domain-containing protein [Armatimonadota bacterium]
MAQVLTVEQAAKKLQLTPRTVREYLKHGMIPGRKLGRSWRILETELEWFLSGSRPVPPEKRISVLGICKDLEGLSSEDFIRRKQEEIRRENRRFPEEAA